MRLIAFLFLFVPLILAPNSTWTPSNDALTDSSIDTVLTDHPVSLTTLRYSLESSGDSYSLTNPPIIKSDVIVETPSDAVLPSSQARDSLKIPLPIASEDTSDNPTPTEENLSLDELKKQRDQALTDAKNKNDTLHSINGKLKDKLAEALEANRTYEDAKGKWEGLEKLAVEKENAWKGPLIKAEAEFEVAEKFFISAKSNLTAANFTLTEAQSDLDEANAKLATVEGRPDRLKKANETKIEKTARETEVNRLKKGIQGDFDTKQTNYNKAKDDAELFQKQYKDANCDDPAKSQTADCISKRSRRDHHNQELSNLTPGFEQVNNTMNGYKAELSTLEQEIKVLTGVIKGLKKDMKNQASDLKGAQDEVDEYTKDVADAQPIFDSTKGIFDQAEIDYNAKKSAKTTAEQKLNAGMPQDVIDAKSDASDADIVKVAARVKLETVNGEVDELKKSAAIAQKSYNEAKTEADLAEKRYDTAMRKDAEAKKGGFSGAAIGITTAVIIIALIILAILLFCCWKRDWCCFPDLKGWLKRRKMGYGKVPSTSANPKPKETSRTRTPSASHNEITSTTPLLGQSGDAAPPAAPPAAPLAAPPAATPEVARVPVIGKGVPATGPLLQPLARERHPLLRWPGGGLPPIMDTVDFEKLPPEQKQLYDDVTNKHGIRIRHYLKEERFDWSEGKPVKPINWPLPDLDEEGEPIVPPEGPPQAPIKPYIGEVHHAYGYPIFNYPYVKPESDSSSISTGKEPAFQAQLKCEIRTGDVRKARQVYERECDNRPGARPRRRVHSVKATRKRWADEEPAIGKGSKKGKLMNIKGSKFPSSKERVEKSSKENKNNKENNEKPKVEIKGGDEEKERSKEGKKNQNK